ncbi:MAG TPA: AAA family ATPase [Patescibacteria group bacterium]
MYLKKVEISGFKSFANKTTLEFKPAEAFSDSQEHTGITAIVGPNGSGKSNVSDAIKWAMGEQSMKTLRGKKSEDIIFAGSGTKARLSSAQVTLHFDNSDKRIPLEYAEVTITRKLFRSGESEYLINGSRSRLIDVQDLLARAGVGKESYCVINQGMSDAVLNATPIERRGVLEDAAGVKQYQIKKERSLKKLESTKENMERVGGLIREIEPHLRLLKRQAEKAQQGKEIAVQLKEKQTALFSYLWDSFQKEREKYSSEKEALGATMTNMQREVEKMSEELNRESAAVQDTGNEDKLEKERAELRSKLNDIERELIISEGRIVVEKEKIANQKVIEIIPVDLKYVQAKVQHIREAQERLIHEVENAESMDDLQDIKEHARAIQQQLYDLHEESGKGEVAIKKDNSKEVQAIQARIDELETKKSALKKNEEVAKRELSEADKAISDAIQKSRQMRERFFQLERESRSKLEQLNMLKDQFNDAKIRLARVEVHEEDLVNEIREELKCEVSDLKYDGSEINREQLEREISRLKLQLEQIGGIDPMIVDEYNETTARFDFLTQELKDLADAIVSLETVVREMDQRISEEFAKAFEQINKEFTKYFRIIFGGGNAHLTKLKVESRKLKVQEEAEGEIKEDAENGEEKKGELGVEIFACPPGKKITNLSMLSGGERSLTSLALLFAIISHNPPPFAILDEVEAALDEANSRRFSKILQELSSHTQFIAITHNRETMRQASLLYGVTMGEDGISKLLSVRLDEIGQGGKIAAK